MVPLGDNYTAQVKIRWYDTDTGAVTRSQDDAADGLAVVSFDETEPDLPVNAPQFRSSPRNSSTCRRGWRGRSRQCAEVPKYVQAVDMGTENTLHEVDYIKIPDTVLYVNTKNYSEQPEGTDSRKGITVKKGYIVDADSTAGNRGRFTNATAVTIPRRHDRADRSGKCREGDAARAQLRCARERAERVCRCMRTPSGAAPAGARGGRSAKQVLEEIMTKIKPAHTEE